MIRFERVSFHYPAGVQALDQVSLLVEPGECLAIVGENGAGKTTLARHINGLLKPTAGRVLVAGADTMEHSVAQLARQAAYVFQNPDDQLFERTVWREIAFGPRNLGLPELEIRERVGRSAALAGIESDLERHPYDLHPVRRKWIALASALAMETPMLVLDEPTSGLDAQGLQRLSSIIAGLKAEGRTVLIISHDVDFCADHFDRIVVMSAGIVLIDGPAGEVFDQDNLLAQAGVDAPQLLRLARALGLPGTPVTQEMFLESLARRAW
jgi:energy-coupling factor transport system ATP-binding protein